MTGDPERTAGVLVRFIAASGAANLADGIATVAWAWAASALTRDAFLIALVPVALRLPWAVLAVPAGIVTDRVDRRRLILCMDALRAAAFAVAALALALALPLPPAPASGVSLPGLFAMIASAALVVGGAEVFRDNAAQTMLPSIVPHDRLEAANGRLWSVEMVANALGSDEGWRDTVHCDVMRREFHRMLLDQHDKPALCRAVGGVPSTPQSELRTHRQEMDLPPAPALLYLVPGDRLAEEHGGF